MEYVVLNIHLGYGIKSNKFEVWVKKVKLCGQNLDLEIMFVFKEL